MALQFKIQLKGVTKPPVWRRVVVPSSYTFEEFHDAIQIVMGWYGMHLYHFIDKEFQYTTEITSSESDIFGDLFGDMFGEDEDEDEDKGGALEASEVKLSDIFKKGVDKFIYVYDFGDDWVHQLTVEKITDLEPKNAHCLAGKGACPPENCGGIHGYKRLKQLLEESPDSPEAEDYKSMLGFFDSDSWDPAVFSEEDLEDVNVMLQEIRE